MKRIRSSISPTLVIIPGIVLLAVLFMSLKSGEWLAILIVAPVFLFMFYTFFNTWYEIEGTILKIRSGFFKYPPVDIATIEKISYTSNPLASPAASFKRLEIKYGNRQYIIISPKYRDSFIELLLQINPNIVVKR
ncbi:MAG: PH domain-containing protein [Chitinophagaceae bacterium]